MGDHADEKIHGYKVLVNASVSEMYCTVIAEALAMGKRVVLPYHVSNHFFQEHFGDRCHFFDHKDVASFRAALKDALDAPWPGPVPTERVALLSWDAALDRLYSAAEVRVLSGDVSRPSEVAGARLAYKLHRGFQTENPFLSETLKQVTLKQSQTMDWAEYLQENFFR